MLEVFCGFCVIPRSSFGFLLITTMSSKSAPRSDKNRDKLSGYVPVAEYLVLKDNYESLSTQHGSLIETLEISEETVERLKKEKREEALVSEREAEMWKNKFGELEKEMEKLAKEKREEALVLEREIEKWENKFGELKNEMGKLTKDVEDMLLAETEMQQPDSGGVENQNVNWDMVVADEDEGVIVISDDEEGNPRESNGGHLNSSNQRPKSSFIL